MCGRQREINLFNYFLTVLEMEIQKQKNGCQMTNALKLSNGFILPEGKMTPNTLFVGGFDMKVDENEIKDFFATYGLVKEVKIITYRGGICKGYGFVSFNEDVDIQTIIEQQLSFKGRKLKLGPAIMKERSARSIQSPASRPLPLGGGAHPVHVLQLLHPTSRGRPPTLLPAQRGRAVHTAVLLLQPPQCLHPTDAHELLTSCLHLPVCIPSLVRRTEDATRQSELCGLWGADTVDSPVAALGVMQ
ncbi:hypothetical protein SKAU_G00298720 [Synaphobranchus kaupii]|uniref:RRM domain-containing protein n=1 Tax=Synaphobranchus kaupii TaxID=118154 RepID=A0A9Q1EVB1_SYNKA|nr:hypothetical protein SKAU_G00298720 [Synaphobranchus kaupii]